MEVSRLRVASCRAPCARRLLGLELPRLARVLYPEGCPQRRWLERYAEVFDTVEVNATFYRLPTRSAVENWVRQAPPGFVFAVKASRYLTHVKRLADMDRVCAGSTSAGSR